jgi:hypothetical protein
MIYCSKILFKLRVELERKRLPLKNCVISVDAKAPLRGNFEVLDSKVGNNKKVKLLTLKAQTPQNHNHDVDALFRWMSFFVNTLNFRKLLCYMFVFMHRLKNSIENNTVNVNTKLNIENFFFHCGQR